MKEWAKIQDTNSVSEEKLPDRISYNASKISKEMSWKVQEGTHVQENFNSVESKELVLKNIHVFFE